MIIYFKVANFKSIKDPLILNFNAASISEHPESNVIEHEKLSLLKSMVLYGHNASGKSKILDAILFFKWFINNSATEKQSNEAIAVTPFAFNESTSGQPGFFEMSFVIDNIKYRYGFEADKESIHKEWLLESKYRKEYPVFMRINQKIEVDYKRFDAESIEKRTRKNALFLSVASQWNVPEAQKIDQWFRSIVAIHGMSDRSYRNYTIELLQDEKYSNLINGFIKTADLGINNFEVTDAPFIIEDVEKVIPKELKDFFQKQLQDKSTKTVFAVHHLYNDNNEITGSVPLSLDTAESEGTKKYFNIIGALITALKEGRLVIIDEFDARLHTLLSKAILKLFNSSELRSTAQLLVASHDTALLDRAILRRDQIYFVEKDLIGATNATSLVEYKVRKEAPYDKNYLEGKYGGIPYIGDLEKILMDE